MPTKNEVIKESADREIVVSRIINAPRELVFKAWTDPKLLVQWWGPKGFTNTFKEIDVRPGGVWRFIMHGPNGVDYPNMVVFTEIVKPERLVYTHGTGEPGDPGEFHVTVTFSDQAGKTNLTMRSIFASAAERDKVVREYGAIEGANQTLDRLEELLSKLS